MFARARCLLLVALALAAWGMLPDGCRAQCGLFGGHAAAQTTYYAPAPYAAYYGAAPVAATTFVPVTRYRPLFPIFPLFRRAYYVPVAPVTQVVGYAPAAACDPCAACPTATFRPLTACCQTAYYAPAVGCPTGCAAYYAPSCCAPSSAPSTYNSGATIIQPGDSAVPSDAPRTFKDDSYGSGAGSGTGSGASSGAESRLKPIPDQNSQAPSASQGASPQIGDPNSRTAVVPNRSWDFRRAVAKPDEIRPKLIPIRQEEPRPLSDDGWRASTAK